MSESYFTLVRLVERLHRHFLDVLRTELRRLNIEEINAVQALLLYNIGENEVVIRDLKDRGYYQGSNVSYNIKKLTEFGYLGQERNPHDRRSVRLKLTERGMNLCTAIRELQAKLSAKVEQQVGPEATLHASVDTLLRLERTWDDFMRYGH